MRYGILNNGVPAPALFRGGYLILEDGRQVPRQALKDVAYRNSLGVMEIQPASFDEGLYTPTGGPSYTDLGNGVWKEEYTLTPRPIGIQMQKKIAAIQTKYEQVVSGGMAHNGRTFSTQESIRANIANLTAFTARGRVQRNKTVLDSEGVPVPMTPAEFTALADAMADHTEDAYDTLMLHITAVRGLSTSQEVMDYDFSTGWPVNPAITVS